MRKTIGDGRFGVLGVALLVLASGSAFAGPVVYGNVGQPATYTPIYATVTGELIGTMVLNGGGGEDKVRLYDETSGYLGVYGLDNRLAANGSTFDFGPVTAGDLLSFDVSNSDDQARIPGLISSTDPSRSQDGVTHAFVSTDGTSVYLSTEDLSAFQNGYTDYNYGDLIYSLSVSQVIAPGAVTATPEPSSLALLGTGLIGMCGAIRRRMTR